MALLRCSFLASLLAVAASAHGFGGGCNVTAPRVKTKNGIVEGFCISDSPKIVNAFLGIPFAAPPVGALRFEKPQSAANWSGILSTKTQPPRCIQTTGDPNSEDCLYLNVFAPARTHFFNKKLPVVVMFYGGAFNTGGARGMGDVSLAKGIVAKDVIVVVPQYRVGILGFGTTGDEVMPGNYGLWDATMSLQWVQANIGAFGGDKHRVTVYGGSAGGTLIDCISLSPHAYNLFHNIYSFAGASRDIFPLNITQRTLNKAAALNITYSDSADLKAQLQAVDNANLKSGWLVITESSFPILQLEWAPTFDGDFFPQDPNVLRALAPPRPRIMGLTVLEGAAFSAAITLTNSSIHDLMDYVVPSGYPNRTGLQAGLVQQYEDLAASVEPTAVVKAAFQSAFGEKMVAGAVVDVVDKLLDVHGWAQPVYMYVFEHFNPDAYGPSYPFISQASHTLEQNYIQRIGAWNFTADDLTVASFCQSFVANFARTGNPNGPGVPINWKRTTQAANERHLRILPSPVFATSNYFGGRPRFANAIGHAAGTIII